MDMRGKNVVVTGAGSGLGKATAMMLAQAGAGVAVMDIREGSAQAVVEDIKLTGGQATAIVGDVRTREAAQASFAQAVAAFGHIDGLVNNAGIYPRRPILEITDDDWNVSLGVNVRGLYNMTIAAVTHMRPRGEGRIVNIASIDAFKPHPKNAHYAAGKAAVVSLTKSFGMELAPLGILVNGIAPGPIATEAAKQAGFLPSLTAETPIGRVAEPEDIAEVILFLVSSRNRYMVGETVVVSGGYYIP
jgi:3-oxoacyl-[acyl-carrier protein] reductase